MCADKPERKDSDVNSKSENAMSSADERDTTAEGSSSNNSASESEAESSGPGMRDNNSSNSSSSSKDKAQQRPSLLLNSKGKFFKGPGLNNYHDNGEGGTETDTDLDDVTTDVARWHFNCDFVTFEGHCFTKFKVSKRVINPR